VKVGWHFCLLVDGWLGCGARRAKIPDLCTVRLGHIGLSRLDGEELQRRLVLCNEVVAAIRVPRETYERSSSEEHRKDCLRKRDELASIVKAASVGVLDDDGLRWDLPEEAERVTLEWNRRMSEEGQNESCCTVCMAEPKDHALVPCGHRFCGECPQRVSPKKRCPTCKQVFQQVIRLYD